MKKLIFITTAIIIAASANSQTLYAPYGQVGYSGNGNVGIGVSWPESLLHVKGELRLDDGDDLVKLGSSNSSGYSYLMFGDDETDRLDFRYAHWQNNQIESTPLMSLSAYGFVGIGTTSPTAPLNVRSNSQMLMQLTGTNNQKVELNINGFASGNPILSFSHQSFQTARIEYDYNNSIGSLAFKIRKLGANFSTTAITIIDDGKVGIGFSPDPPSSLEYDLTVNGSIGCNLIEVKDIVASNLKLEISNVADYVFADDYELRSLPEVKDYVTENRHLPEIPSASEMEEQGVDVAEMSNLLLRKIEELTLYIIEQDEKIATQNQLLRQQSERIAALENK